LKDAVVEPYPFPERAKLSLTASTIHLTPTLIDIVKFAHK
jgi:hypothetical protein